MRLCSFIPSATEIIYLLGEEDNLFGVTHECDYPRDAFAKPNVVTSVFDELEDPSSEHINEVISDRLKNGLGIYKIDEDVLASAEPDIIFTQQVCEV
jgi:iron complex transport system substrate-binding protein